MKPEIVQSVTAMLTAAVVNNRTSSSNRWVKKSRIVSDGSFTYYCLPKSYNFIYIPSLSTSLLLDTIIYLSSEISISIIYTFILLVLIFCLSVLLFS